MKRVYIMIGMCIFLMGLTACTGPAAENTVTVKETEKTVGTMEAKEPGEPADSSMTEPEAEEPQKGGEADREAMREAYSCVLKDLYYNHMFPGQQNCGYDDFNDMSENRFAVYDIDRDGKEELIIEYTTTIMAGKVEKIYDFDNASNMVREEFSEFPALKFYDNGVVWAEWSHNQGVAGEFWPYTLYQYDSKADAYIEVAMVDAWDRSLAERYNGNLFPVEADIDGDGIVYYIMGPGEYELNEPVDLERYNQWKSSYVGEAEQLEIPFQELTEENISKYSVNGSTD